MFHKVCLVAYWYMWQGARVLACFLETSRCILKRVTLRRHFCAYIHVLNFFSHLVCLLYLSRDAILRVSGRQLVLHQTCLLSPTLTVLLTCISVVLTWVVAEGVYGGLRHGIIVGVCCNMLQMARF